MTDNPAALSKNNLPIQEIWAVDTLFCVISPAATWGLMMQTSEAVNSTEVKKVAYLKVRPTSSNIMQRADFISSHWNWFDLKKKV